jgi:hypothetical protein
MCPAIYPLVVFIGLIFADSLLSKIIFIIYKKLEISLFWKDFFMDQKQSLFLSEKVQNAVQNILCSDISSGKSIIPQF